jgi:hypothetical protein
MDSFDDIREIWATAKTSELPNLNEVLKTIKGHQVKHKLKSIAVIIATLFLVMVMIWVVFFYKSSMLTTRIGEGCFFIAMFILIGANVTSLRRAAKVKNCTNEEYVRYLKTEQIQLATFIKKTQAIGFAIVSIGLLLYVFEFVYKNNFSILLSYLIVTLYILLAWFVIRPIATRKKTKRLNETIEKLEKLANQLSNN